MCFIFFLFIFAQQAVFIYIPVFPSSVKHKSLLLVAHTKINKKSSWVFPYFHILQPIHQQISSALLSIYHRCNHFTSLSSIWDIITSIEYFNIILSHLSDSIFPCAAFPHKTTNTHFKTHTTMFTFIDHIVAYTHLILLYSKVYILPPVSNWDSQEKKYPHPYLIKRLRCEWHWYGPVPNRSTPILPSALGHGLSMWVAEGKGME